MNHAIIVIRIGEEKQKEYTQILCGSEVCLHPWEGIYNNFGYD